MRARPLFTLKSLTLMLALCFVLTAEETIHLLRSRPNDTDRTRTITHHPGCIPLDAAGRILRCPVRGYGDMNFLCSDTGCLGKEPTVGLFIPPAENQLIERQPFK